MFKFILRVAIAVVFFVLTLFSAIVLTPMFLFRYLAAKILAPVFRPDLGKILTTRSQIFAIDKLFDSPKCNILVMLTLRNNSYTASMPLSELIEVTIRNNWLGAKNDEGTLKYPELQQYPTSWLGYYFWKNDENFDLQNHIRVYEPHRKTAYSSEELENVRNKLLSEKWPRKRSPWEVVIINQNFEQNGETQPNSILFGRFHHCGADGFSIIRMCMDGIFNVSIDHMLPKFPERPILRKILDAIKFPILASYDSAKLLMVAHSECQQGAWAVKDSSKTYKMHSKLVQKFSVSKIREIKRTLKVSFTSVLFAIISEGLRDLMERKRMKIPKNLPCILPLPVPQNTVKLRNELTGTRGFLPVKHRDILKTLELCQEEYEKLKRNTVPLVTLMAFKFMGLCVTPLTKLLAVNLYGSVGIDNFPGWPEVLEYQGLEVTDAMFALQHQFGICGLLFCIISYADGLRINISGIDELLSEDDLTFLSNAIVKHFQTLCDLVQT